MLLSGCSCQPSHKASTTASVQPATPALTAEAASALPAANGIYYTFSVADDLSSIAAAVCFVGPRPAHLVAPTSEAAPLLRSANKGSTSLGDPLPIHNGSIALEGVADRACVHYQVDTTGALDADNMRDGASFVGADALLSPDWWLWAPEGDDPPDVFARFDASKTFRAELPWPHESRGAYDRRIPPSAFIWKAQGGFAKRAATTLTVGSARLDVTVLGGGFGERQAAVSSWLKTSANAVASLLGAFPLSRAQVLLVADPDRRSSFGYALRGGGPSATMLLSAAPSDEDLANDWTAVHELFHFSHPPMATSEAWFYEGLATYFTALARARSGMTTKRYGWWELLDGFERGSKVGTGQTLREECKTMHQNRTYWRVYWSGAFMLLKMDVELRRRGQTLEQLIARLAASHPDDTKRWTAEKIVQQLDALCDCDIPSRVTAEHLDATEFPKSVALVSALGVALAEDQSVTYDDAAPDAAIRRAIMAGD